MGGLAGHSRPVDEGTSLKGLVYASLFGALTSLGALLAIPLPPVPVTMQTLFVYLSGILLGARLGAMSQAAYVTVGALGFPVFAGGKSGLGILLGPTGGYLWGFIAGAWVVGKICEKRGGDRWIRPLLAISLGGAVIFILGIAQLMVAGRMSFPQAVAIGLVGFLPGEVLKMVLAYLLCRAVQDRIRRPNILQGWVA